MRRPPEMTKRQFTISLQRNGFKQVLLWVQDTTGQVSGISWGMVMHRGGKMAYRATLAKVLRERAAQIVRDENSTRSPGFINTGAKTVQECA